MWNKALNQAEIEAFSALRRAKNIYYPPTIRASSSLGSKADTASKEIDIGKDSPAKALPSFNRLVRKKKMQPKEWSLKLLSPQLCPRTPLRVKKPFRAWRLF